MRGGEYKEKESFQLFIYLADLFISVGLTVPVILKPIYLVWMIFAVILGWFMTRLILSLLFYMMITPIGLVLRLMGKDLLELKRQEVQNSYWNMRDFEKEQNQNYKNNFNFLSGI